MASYRIDLILSGKNELSKIFQAASKEVGVFNKTAEGGIKGVQTAFKSLTGETTNVAKGLKGVSGESKDTADNLHKVGVAGGRATEEIHKGSVMASKGLKEIGIEGGRALEEITKGAEKAKSPLIQIKQHGHEIGQHIHAGSQVGATALQGLSKHADTTKTSIQNVGKAGRDMGNQIAKGTEVANKSLQGVQKQASATSSSLDGVGSLIGGLAGGLTLSSIGGAMWSGSTQREFNQAYLEQQLGKEQAGTKALEIRKIVAEVPGDDTFMNTLLQGAAIRKASSPGLQQLGWTAADYLAASQMTGQTQIEAQQDLNAYILTGNTAELERSRVLQGQVDKLKGITDINKRILALNEALNANHFQGLSKLEVMTIKWEVLKGKIQLAATNLGDKILPYLEQGVDYLTALDEQTGGWSTQVGIVTAGIIALGIALGPVVWSLKQIGIDFGSIAGKVKDFVLPSTKKVTIDCEKNDNCKCDGDSGDGTSGPKKSSSGPGVIETILGYSAVQKALPFVLSKTGQIASGVGSFLGSGALPLLGSVAAPALMGLFEPGNVFGRPLTPEEKQASIKNAGVYANPETNPNKNTGLKKDLTGWWNSWNLGDVLKSGLGQGLLNFPNVGGLISSGLSRGLIPGNPLGAISNAFGLSIPSDWSDPNKQGTLANQLNLPGWLSGVFSGGGSKGKPTGLSYGVGVGTGFDPIGLMKMIGDKIKLPDFSSWKLPDLGGLFKDLKIPNLGDIFKDFKLPKVGDLFKGLKLPSFKWPTIPDIVKTIQSKLPKINFKFPTINDIINTIKAKIPWVSWKIPSIDEVIAKIKEKVPWVNWKIPTLADVIARVKEKIPWVTWSIPSLGDVIARIKEKIPWISWNIPSLQSVLDAIVKMIPPFKWPWGPAGTIKSAVSSRMSSLSGIDFGSIMTAMNSGFKGLGAFTALANAIFSKLSYSSYMNGQKSDAGVISSGSANCYDSAELLMHIAQRMGISAGLQNGVWDGTTIPHTWAIIGGIPFDGAAKTLRGSWLPPSGPDEPIDYGLDAFMMDLGPALEYVGYGGTAVDPISALVGGGNCFDMTLGLMGAASSLYGAKTEMVWGNWGDQSHVWARINGRDYDPSRMALNNTWNPPPQGPGGSGNTYIILNGDVYGWKDFKKQVGKAYDELTR